MGVWIAPCGVWIVPARAQLSGHSASIVNVNGGMYFYSFSTNLCLCLYFRTCVKLRQRSHADGVLITLYTMSIEQYLLVAQYLIGSVAHLDAVSTRVLEMGDEDFEIVRAAGRERV